MQNAVVLFDIDGTLITCGGAGRSAMERAFVDVAGKSDVLDFPFGGMTDRGIARVGLEHAGARATDAEIDRLLAVYVTHLAEAVARSERYRVLDGVERVLDRIAPLAHVAVGLGTGNVEDGARIKLVRGALWERFAFGGFGSDAEDRAELLARGAARGRERLGDERARVIIIGDTPRDVIAGRAIGAEVIAVATGGYEMAVLNEHAPDLLVATLEDESVVRWIER